LTEHKNFRVSPVVAWVVTQFAGENSVQALNSNRPSSLNLTVAQLESLVSDLKLKKILVSPNDSEHLFAKQLAEHWSGYGWRAAADYHLATIDYPFVPDKDGTYRAQDSQTMQSYKTQEPDVNRSKDYSDVVTIDLPPVKEVLTMLDMPFSDVIQSKIQTNSLSFANLSYVMSATFGCLRERPNSYGAPSVRKTSPSGGARHPTEGYLFLKESLPEIEQGIYHFSVRKNVLEKLPQPFPESLEELFPGVFRASFAPKALICLTSLFERNMYRYREPRTFRTIFIDAGHLSSTFLTLCNALGLQGYGPMWIMSVLVQPCL
jgi:SagB-type dehydrogenase family enzyme